MNYQRTVLANGLRVLTIPMPSFESATVLVMVGAGSRYENKKNTGISHFFEHMAFKGTKTRPSALDISSLIDGIGGEFNAFTGKETTGFYIKSLASHVNLTMDVLSDMLQNSLLDPQEIDKERGVIIEEINMYEDMPTRKIGDIYEELLYGDTPMGWDIGGEKDVIRSVTRDDFESYLHSLYSADNITVVVAGGVTNKQGLDLAQKYFGNMKRFDTLKYEKVIENQKKPAVFLKHKKTEQVHVALGVRTTELNHPDRYPLWVLSSILGGGMSSRLFTEVREKRGLAYYIRTHSDHYEDVGSLVTMAGIDVKRATDAIKVIIEQYRKIGNEDGITTEELKKAKEYVKGHLVLELEDSRSVAGHYASSELLEKAIDNPDEILKKLDAVTKEEVEDAAKKYLTRPLNLAVIGNFEDKAQFESLLANSK
ncbi:MAG TPA: pitrilysin family protein [Candidatus Saccharimonadales bacterium]|nr:pitrilysin family protein [Candidatus Saccharimonadales bacterium]